ncbi:MMPL family transporter [Streptomyces silvisoli]|uniref:MMPL family transporter n=1 Tax=Streptomyces silvisoli TaxID=3034235 RepID=UPI0023E3292D|nr:MMPL family transporter [Streptomyces silvisoli]
MQSYWPRRLCTLRTADLHHALALVRFRGTERAVRIASDDVIARHTGQLGPLHVSGAGRDAVLSESDRLSEHGLHLAEAIGAPLILVVLLWVFASAVSALLPVLVGAFAVVTTTAFLLPGTAGPRDPFVGARVQHHHRPGFRAGCRLQLAVDDLTHAVRLISAVLTDERAQR